MASVWGELKRRNVVKVAVAYAIVGWLLVQIADIFFPALQLPEWTVTFVAGLVLLGFPIALILSWAYELTPDGMERTKSVPLSESITNVTGRKLDFAIIGLLLLTVGFLVVNYVLVGDEAALVVEQPTGSPIPVVEETQQGVPANSIAVLAFTNMSSDPEQEYFSDGISEEILNGLAHLPGLRVAARTSAFSFKGQNTDIRTIGEALDVDHVLEGSVRRMGNRVRITAQLIKVDDGFRLWSDEYDRELTDIFAVQDDIADAVVDALRVQLLGDSPGVRDGYRTASVNAHDAYLLGRHRIVTRRTEDLLAARDYFLRATEIDSEYAAAYEGLASAYVLLNAYGAIGLENLIANGKPVIERALELAPRMGEAYSTRANISRSNNEFVAAEADFRRALDLNPNNALAYHFYAIHLQYWLGRYEEAHEMRQQAFDLDPLSPAINWQFGNLLAAEGEFDAAREYYRRDIEIAPSFPNAYASLAWLEIMVGNLTEGLRLHRTAVALDPDSPFWAANVACTYIALGDLDRAQDWLNYAANLHSTQFGPSFVRELIPLVMRREDPTRLMSVIGLVQNPRDRIATVWSPIIRQAALQSGNLPGAQMLFRQIWPELVTTGDPDVGPHNVNAAIDMAWILLNQGDIDGGEELLDKSLTVMRSNRESMIMREDIVEVRALALLGQEEEALSALRRAIDRGWRYTWWLVEADPTLSLISDHPDFIVMLDEVKADLAVQLERVREMERNGELAPLPQVVATQ